MKNQQSANQKRSEQSRLLWESRREEIITLYGGEWSQQRLADKYGVSLCAVWKAMRKMGIPAKPKYRTGKQNGRYIHGKETTLYRSMVKKKICAHCEATTNLCIHHKDENHYNNCLENLEVLCMSCHSSMHKKQWWDKRKSSGA